jgi:hypothetical protein
MSARREVLIRYRVKPGSEAENQRLVENVYAALHQLDPPDFHYATFVLEDGVTFVHLATSDSELARETLPDLPAFQEFQAGLAERCEEPPVFTTLHCVGSFRQFD